MLVEDLARVFSLILEDYNQFKIDDLFNVTQAALQSRSNVQNYNVHATNVGKMATDLIHNSRYANLPRRHKDLFEASKFASASPERLGNMFLAALHNDPQRAISSGELNGDKDAYNNARSAMNAFLGACGQVNIGPMIKDGNKAHFQLSFSESNYEKKMEATANILKRWSNAFNLISRYSMGKIEPIEIEYVGTTDLTLWLSTSFLLIPVVLTYYNQIIESVDRTIKVLTAINVMKAVGHAPAGAPDSTKIIESNVSAIVDSFIKSVPAEIEKRQQEELIGGIRVSSSLLVEDVLNGARIHVEYSKDIVPVDKSKYQTYNEDKIRELLTQKAELELRIADYSGREKVLLPPKDEESSP
jgi:hypothetical protein